MTYDNQKIQAGRKPVQLIEVTLDYCANTYGTSPCSASGAAGSECYNTRETCQDFLNYSATTKVYYFSDIPIIAEPYIPCIDSVTTAPTKITPGNGLGQRASIDVVLNDFPHNDVGIDPYYSTRTHDPLSQGTFFGKLIARNPYYYTRSIKLRTGYLENNRYGAGNFEDRNYIIESISGPDQSGKVRITAKDILKLADDDQALCPNPSEIELRAAVTSSSTTIPLTSLIGLAPETGNVLTNSEFGSDTVWTKGIGWSISGGEAHVSTFGPSASAVSQASTLTNGSYYLVVFTITSNDTGGLHAILGGTNGTTRYGRGTYYEVIQSSGTTAWLSTAGGVVTASIDNVYIYPIAGSGTVRINNELINYTTIDASGPSLGGLTRGAHGTVADAHDQNDLVQYSYVVTNGGIVDVLEDLLMTFAGIPSSYIPSTDWTTEETKWLANYQLNRVVSKPTGVNKLISEILSECNIDLWWDEVNQEIILKANVPPSGDATYINDDYHILENSITTKDVEKNRLSQVWIYYGKRNQAANDDEENYQRLHINTDVTIADSEHYAKDRIKVIKSKWLGASSNLVVETTANRLLRRYTKTPRVVEFALDAKDSDFNTGDLVILSSRAIQDFDGSNIEYDIQILSKQEVDVGTKYKYRALTSQWSFFERYAYIATDGSSAYSTATDEEKATQAYISDDDGTMPDGSPGYSII